jgi:hypothetical protein
MTELNLLAVNGTMLGVCFALIVWIFRMTWNKIKELSDRQVILQERVQQVELLIAGDYVHKEEFRLFSNALFTRLDKIADKLDEKVDKH